MVAYKLDIILYPLYNETQCPFTDLSVFLYTSDGVHTISAIRTESTPSIQNWKLCMSCPVKVDTVVQKNPKNCTMQSKFVFMKNFCLSMCICLNTVSHDKRLSYLCVCVCPCNVFLRKHILLRCVTLILCRLLSLHHYVCKCVILRQKIQLALQCFSV